MIWERWTVSSCEPYLRQRTTSKGANLLCYLSSLDLSVGHVLCLCQWCLFMGTLAHWMSSTKLPELEPRQPPWEAPFFLSLFLFSSLCLPSSVWLPRIHSITYNCISSTVHLRCLPACQKGWASFPKSGSCWPFRKHIPTVTSENTDHPQLWAWWAGYGRLTEVPQ